MNLDMDTLVAAQAQHIVTLSDEAHALKRELEEVTKHCDENQHALRKELADENERGNRLATQVNELDGALKNANARIEALDLQVDTQRVVSAVTHPIFEASKIAKRILAGDVTPATHMDPPMWAYVTIALAHHVTPETMKYARAYYADRSHGRMGEIMFMQLAVDLNHKLTLTQEFVDYAKQYEGVYRAAGDSRMNKNIERAKRVAPPTRVKRKPKLANTSKRRVTTKGNEAR